MMGHALARRKMEITGYATKTSRYIRMIYDLHDCFEPTVKCTTIGDVGNSGLCSLLYTTLEVLFDVRLNWTQGIAAPVLQQSEGLIQLGQLWILGADEEVPLFDPCACRWERHLCLGPRYSAPAAPLDMS